MATAHLHFQTQPINPNRRRRRRETTITASAANQFPNKSSPDNPSASDLEIPPSSMESSNTAAVQGGALDQFTKFNSALTAGLLSPPPQQSEKTRSSPTLFEMMASETDCHPRVAVATTLAQNGVVSAAPPNSQLSLKFVSNSNPTPPPLPPQDKQALLQQRLMDFLQSRSPGNQFNDAVSGDVKLTLSSNDGINVSINVHRQILAAHSSFFASKLNEEWAKQQKSGTSVVEIADCDDVEVYVETLRLMYCRDLRKKLMKDDVPRVLGILKVSAAIGFDAGVLSCLEYLEAAPWAEDEEDKISALLSELKLEGVGAVEVLKRVSVDVKSGSDRGNNNEQVLLKLLHAVLEGKDEKARREMKNLVTKMLRENSSPTDLRKESLYSACDGCLKSLREYFLNAADGNVEDASRIARQADNLHWLLDILIDRQIAEDFLTTWGSESELSEAHCKVAAVHRHEVSRVTARLFVGIGKGQLLASKEARCLLLQTWLGPFYDDFGWMRRAGRGLDRHLVEEGLSHTILTLPMMWQQDVLMGWFDRFLNSGDDCPNIQRAFAVWWRRAFWKRNGGIENNRRIRILEEK